MTYLRGSGLALLLVQFFRAGIHNSAFAVCLVVYIVGILYILLVLNQLTGSTDEIGFILIGNRLILGSFLGFQPSAFT